MAKLIFGLSQSLDGYVDHREMLPDPALFRHFVEHVRDPAEAVCMVAARTRSCFIGTKTCLIGTWSELDFCGGVAKPTEVGRVALVEVSRPPTLRWSRMTSGPRWGASLRLGSSGRLTSPDQTWCEA